MHRKLLIPLLAISAMLLTEVGQAQEPQCRQYTKEIRAGGGQGDRYGTMCLQPDGTWKVVDAQTETQRNGGVIQFGPSSFSGSGHSANTQSRTRIYSTHPDSPTQLVIEDNVPAYVVVDPYYWHGNYRRRDWSPSKRHFNRYHHGPGWQKHWKHHQKVLKKD